MLAWKKLEVYTSKLEKKQNKRLSHCILLVFPEKSLSICELVCVCLGVCVCVCVCLLTQCEQYTKQFTKLQTAACLLLGC